MLCAIGCKRVRKNEEYSLSDTNEKRVRLEQRERKKIISIKQAKGKV
jgi:hypothetical protein